VDVPLAGGSGGVFAVYDAADADAVDIGLANAIKESVAHIDRVSTEELRAGLTEAQRGMGGG
jgi:hypothetical protein